MTVTASRGLERNNSCASVHCALFCRGEGVFTRDTYCILKIAGCHQVTMRTPCGFNRVPSREIVNVIGPIARSPAVFLPEDAFGTTRFVFKSRMYGEILLRPDLTTYDDTVGGGRLVRRDEWIAVSHVTIIKKKRIRISYFHSTSNTLL